MKDTAPDGTLDMATASKALGVHLQTALSLVQRGLLDAERIGGKWRTTPAAIELYQRREALADAFGTSSAGHAGAARLLQSRAAAHLEVEALRAEAARAREGGDFDRALVLTEFLAVLDGATFTFDAATGSWSASFPRPLPELSASAELVPA